ncbi:acetolactate synthase large subunit [Azospirillum rugosum]|uniref:Acetolactate synthase-1/2/3 large subunit n=1 Tax=Azospirillum rugosum TaxID=416170 RepID=A0ABS4SFZ2_9PROT|nr:acetolactate synthase large subunit [Azospirillum rugosum]MBP2291483.1 acetolactate synthase-1/2/3 large subunit [Azospirillum rugosum]MDQ0525271.1 acetolactate synthase-1/2/3 large subunit [Azospirillum rugosum]
MIGAEILVKTLIANGVGACFANPGTSELHALAAFDSMPGVRCVPTLFEGVATGAADGYARMTGTPAATLLHLGPGLANGLANLHNARRARVPLLNIVGDHATWHRSFDAPLTSDVEALAAPMSGWVRTVPDAASVARDTADAIRAALTPPGQVATLILPSNSSWDETPAVEPIVVEPPAPAAPDAGATRKAAEALRGGARVVLLLNGAATSAAGLTLAGRIAAKTGAKVFAHTGATRIERGAGRVAVERLPYPIDLAIAALAGAKHVVLIGATEPVAFFGYPGKPSRLTPDGCRIHDVAPPGADALAALRQLAEEVGAAGDAEPTQSLALPGLATGALNADSIGQSLAALLPEGAVVVDEALTSSTMAYTPCTGARPHDWLTITGGSIGIGMPLALGAAIACPDRKVVNLQADGSGMYTLQALWSQAREGAEVVTIVFANRRYGILQWELGNLGFKEMGENARNCTDIGRPDLNWVSLARGMGVEAGQATDADSFNRLLKAAFAHKGPFLIEAVI